METIRIFDNDSYLKNFEANILSCAPCDAGFDIILDKTAFFPEGGGQKPDTGKIGIANVLDVQEENRIIHHYCDVAINKAQVVECRINWENRFSRMQNHSGEHVFSGIIHSLTGYDNIGFHMGEKYMTLDFSGEIDSDTLNKAELLANKAIYDNRKITSSYPAKDELSKIEYRSKLELNDNIRIVQIEEIDTCACCAPHVKNTGEIGIIKMLGSMRHRGGTRVFITCGQLALNEFILIHNEANKISNLLSVKPEEISDAVIKLNSDFISAKASIALERKKYAEHLAKSALPANDIIIIFDENLSMDDLREAVNCAAQRDVKHAAALSGNDDTGYTYVIKSNTLPLNSIAKELNKLLNGRGGGRPEIIQGSFKSSRKEIEHALIKLLST